MATFWKLISLLIVLVAVQFTGAQYYGGMYRPYGMYGPYGGYRPYGMYGPRPYGPMMSPAGRAMVGLGLLASSVGKK